MPASRSKSMVCRLAVGATAVILGTGLSAGVAGATTADLPAATAAPAELTQPAEPAVSSASGGSAKASAGSVFSCERHPNIFYC